MPHRKHCEKATDLITAKLVRGSAANKSLNLPPWGGWGARWALGCLHWGTQARLPSRAKQEPNGMSGLISLLCRLVLACQFTEKWGKACARTWRMAVFVAEIEVEAGPLVVVRAVGRGHRSPFQPPLKGYPGFSGNWLHRKNCG